MFSLNVERRGRAPTLKQAEGRAVQTVSGKRESDPEQPGSVITTEPPPLKGQARICETRIEMVPTNKPW